MRDRAASALAELMGSLPQCPTGRVRIPDDGEAVRQVARAVHRILAQPWAETAATHHPSANLVARLVANRWATTRFPQLTAYRRAVLDTSPPLRLVVLLHGCAVASASRAAEAIGRVEFPEAHEELVRAEAAIFELRVALTPQAGPLAGLLGAVYEYFYGQLVWANLRKRAEPASVVGSLMGSLFQAWETVLRPPARPMV